jgi:DNA-binding MarR family transcriptional regulator
MDLEEKIFSALERIHIASRSGLQKSVQGYGVSVLQAQIMRHVDLRKSASVSQLAEQLKVSKPTISDAVASLLEKELVKKIMGAEDARGYHLTLTDKGKIETSNIFSYATPFLKTLNSLNNEQKEAFWDALLYLLKTMQGQGLIPPQRMCFSCQYFEQNKDGDRYYCKLMKMALSLELLRADCNEHKQVNT